MARIKGEQPAKAKCEEATPNTDPNWEGKCEVCGQSPVVGDLGLCGPCCFGEADTIGGNW